MNALLHLHYQLAQSVRRSKGQGAKGQEGEHKRRGDQHEEKQTHTHSDKPKSTLGSGGWQLEREHGV
jgi:hypothetical protein